MLVGITPCLLNIRNKELREYLCKPVSVYEFKVKDKLSGLLRELIDVC